MKRAREGDNGRRQAPTPSPLRRMEFGHSVLSVLPASVAKAPDTAMPAPLPIDPKHSRVGKKKVLEEEAFVDAIEGIIGRDFFPELPLLKRQLKWLHTVTVGRDGRMIASPAEVERVKKAIESEQRKIGATPLPSPMQGETDDERKARGDKSARGRARGGCGGDDEDEEDLEFERVNTDNMSLSDFQRMHTSEDSESFQMILEDDQAKKRKLYWWAHSGAIEAIGGDPSKPQLYLLPSGELMTAERRAIMDKALASSVEKAGYDKRPGELESWKHRPRNQLSFPPELEVSKDTCRIGDADSGGGGGGGAAATMLSITERGEQALGKSKEKPRIEWKEAVSTSAASSAASSSAASGAAAAASGEAAAAAGPAGAVAGGGGEVVVGGGGEPRKEGEASRSGSSNSSGGGKGGAVNPLVAVSSSSSSSALIEGPLYTKLAGTGVLKNAKVIQHKSTRLSGAFLQRQRQEVREALGLSAPAISSGGGGSGSSSSGSTHARHTPSPLERPDSNRSSVMELDVLEGVKGRGSSDSGGGGGGGNSYRPVEMTPLIEPGGYGDSPMMTWGQVEGTPMRIDPIGQDLTPFLEGLRQMREDYGDGTLAGEESDAGHKFQVKEQPYREALAHALEAKKKNSKKGSSSSSSSSSALPKPITVASIRRQADCHSSGGGGNSSAKQTLLARLSGTRALSAASPFGGSLSARYSQPRSASAGVAAAGKGEGKGGGGGGSGSGLTPSLTPGRRGVRASAAAGNGKGKGKPPVNTDGLM